MSFTHAAFRARRRRKRKKTRRRSASFSSVFSKASRESAAFAGGSRHKGVAVACIKAHMYSMLYNIHLETTRGVPGGHQATRGRTATTSSSQLVSSPAFFRQKRHVGDVSPVRRGDASRENKRRFEAPAPEASARRALSRRRGARGGWPRLLRLPRRRRRRPGRRSIASSRVGPRARSPGSPPRPSTG